MHFWLYRQGFDALTMDSKSTGRRSRTVSGTSQAGMLCGGGGGGGGGGGRRAATGRSRGEREQRPGTSGTMYGGGDGRRAYGARGALERLRPTTVSGAYGRGWSGNRRQRGAPGSPMEMHRQQQSQGEELQWPPMMRSPPGKSCESFY